MSQFAFGGGALYAVRTDVTGAPPVRFGALQDVNLDFSGDLKELYGQGQFALAQARGKSKITGKASFAQVNGVLFNNLFFGQTLTNTQTLVAQNEAATVPAAASYTVTAANGATFVNDLGVFYVATGLPLTRVTASPTIGQYSVSTAGVYSFAAGDASASVWLNYAYTYAASGSRIAIGNPMMGQTPVFQAVFNEIFNGKQLTLQLNACVASKLSLPTKNDDWLMADLEFQAQADSAGNVGFLSLAE